ncbi:MAG: Methyltransferase type 11 [Brevundimonas sp.]|nr:Methyltransferase type 11 [Brevundimonas sp.]
MSEKTVKQIIASQTRLLEQFSNDPAFVKRMGRHPLHGRFLEGLPKPAGQRVLELGCGPGKYAALLNTAGFEVVGVDPATFPDTWGPLREKAGLTLMDGVFAEDLPFPDDHFDHVVCSGTLLYVEDPDKSLEEIKRVVKPGGRLILRTVNSANFYTSVTGKRLDPGSKQLYTMAELKELVASHGFRIDRTFSFGFWPPYKTDLWFYLQCVWIPAWGLSLLSALTPPGRRVNIAIFATAP